MLRWSEDEMREYQQRQGRSQANQEARQHQKEEVRSKYRNKKITVDGITFDSKAESARYCQLKQMQRADLIANLQCQVRYDLVVNGQLICKYFADFVYHDNNDHVVVEDVKGGKVTRDYAIKKKLMKAIHGITIIEVRMERPQ